MHTPHNASKKDTKFLNFRVSVDLSNRVRFAALRMGISVQAFCVEAVERHLARAEKRSGNGHAEPTVRKVIEVIRKKSTSTE